MSDTATLLTACPHCRRRYRVRTDQVPSSGIRARCPHCGAMFPIVPRLGESPAPVPVSNPPEPDVNQAGLAGPQTANGAPVPAASIWSQDLERARPQRGAIAEVRPRPMAHNGSAEGSGPESASVTTQPALPEDLVVAHDDARSLARALASDLLAYYPDAVREGASAATLMRLMSGEIAESWDLYVREVGEELAGETRYFQEALNECLVGGKEYF